MGGSVLARRFWRPVDWKATISFCKNDPEGPSQIELPTMGGCSWCKISISWIYLPPPDARPRNSPG